VQSQYQQLQKAAGCVVLQQPRTSKTATQKQHSNGKSNTNSASCNLGSRKSQSSCYRVITLSLKEHSWEAAVLQAALQHEHAMHLEIMLARIKAP
jgi:hypothetical protein